MKDNLYISHKSFGVIKFSEYLKNPILIEGAYTFTLTDEVLCACCGKPATTETDNGDGLCQDCADRLEAHALTQKE